jgi:hypothetical protein
MKLNKKLTFISIKSKTNSNEKNDDQIGYKKSNEKNL